MRQYRSDNWETIEAIMPKQNYLKKKANEVNETLVWLVHKRMEENINNSANNKRWNFSIILQALIKQ